MNILHLACLNNDPEIQPNMDPKCNPVGGETLRCCVAKVLSRNLIVFARNRCAVPPTAIATISPSLPQAGNGQHNTAVKH